MPSLTKNKEVFNSVANLDVVSSNPPSGDVGISKTVGEEGFFIKSETTFTLWFKNQSGVWGVSDNNATTGTYSWGANQCFYIQSNSANNFYVFRRMVAPGAMAVVKRGDLSNRSRIFDPATSHDKVSSSWTTSGHTGEPYSIGMFGISGAGGFLSAPPSGQREGNILGWDENGGLGWIPAPVSVSVSVTSPSQYWDGSSTSTQVGSNTIALGGATLSTADGKYGSDSFNFGASGNKQPILVGNDISLSTGIYTFSLWFKNKRSGSDWGSVFRQTSTGTPVNTGNYPILIRNTDNALGIFKREGGVNTFHSTGYTMTSFEGDSNWNHLVVIADGTNSTFYINGSQVGNSIAKVITTSVGEIGAYDGNDTQVFAEGLDEVAYWDSALTAAQIATIYNSSDKLSVLAPPPEFTLSGNTTETDGVYCLDGSGDYVTYNRDHRFTDQFSISVWFKSDGITSPFDTIISNHDGGNIANGNTFMLYSSGKLRIKTADSGTGTTGDALNLGSGLGDGGWHQVVVTWQANTTNGRKVYIDGSLVHQNNTGTAVYRTTAQSLMYLGGMWIYTTNSFSTNGFNGCVTGFSMDNSILTAQQVSDSYVTDDPTPVPVPTSANLEEASEAGPVTIFEDAQLLSGMFVDTQPADGRVEGTFHDDYKPDNLTQPFTFSGFYRADSANVGGKWIDLFDAWNGNKGFKVWIYHNSATRIQFRINYNGTQSWIHPGNLNGAYGYDEFHHIGFTSDNGTFKLYVNGNLASTLTGKNFLPETPTNGLYKIGGNSALCAVDKVDIYKGTALTDAEMLTLANTRTSLDTAYDAAIATYQSSIPAPIVSSDLQVTYLDSNNASQPTTAFEDGFLSNGMYFDTLEANGRVEGDFHNNYKPVSGLDPFSFSGFYRADSANVSGKWIDLFDAWNGNKGFKVWIYHNSATRVQFRINHNGTQDWIHPGNFNGTYGYDEFHHIGFTAYNGVVKLYINGVLASTQTGKYFLPETPVDGLYKIGGNSALCAVDGVAIHRGTLLSDAEMLTLANTRTSYDTKYDTERTAYEASLSNVNTFQLEDDATYNGEATLQNGTIYTDGSTSANDYCYGNFSNDLIPDSNLQKWSFSTYYKVDEVNATGWVYLYNARSGNSGLEILAYQTSPTRIQLRVYLNGVENWIHPGNIDNVCNAYGEWNHISITSYKSVVKYYINGLLTHTFTNKEFVPGVPTNNQYKIGAGTSQCSIENVSIYKGHLLNQAEITALADNLPVDGSGSPATSLDGSSLVGSGVSLSDNGVVSTNSVTFNGQNVLDFSSATQEVTITPAWNLNGTYTFSHWFRDMPTGNLNTFARNAAGESVLQVHNQNLRMRQSSTNHYGPSMSAYKELDTWTHLAVVADGTDSKVYINGALFHTFTGVVSNDVTNIFGNQPWSQGQQTWANYIADVRQWNSALTEAEILALYNAG